MRGTPHFSLDFNSPCEDLDFLHGPNLAQKPLYLVVIISLDRLSFQLDDFVYMYNN